MLPSLAINNNASAIFSQPDALTSPLIPPLTLIQVNKETTLSSEDQNAARFRDEFFWFENEKIASLNGRITFINKVTDEIIHTMPSKDTPITLISLGAGGLLTEAYIHQRLRQANYKNIAWRIIDVLYSEDCTQNILKQFRYEVEGNCRSFTTEQAYFNKTIGHGSLVEDDKIRGEIILLSINPSTVCNDPTGRQSAIAEGVEFTGMKQSDHNKANAIFLLLASHKNKHVLDQHVQALSEGQTSNWNYGLICYIDNDGRPAYKYNLNAKGRFLHKTVSDYLEPPGDSTPSTESKITLNDIDTKLKEFLTVLKHDGIVGKIYLTSDYDVSLLKLKGAFGGRPSPALFTSFNKNEIEIEKIA